MRKLLSFIFQFNLLMKKTLKKLVVAIKAPVRLLLQNETTIKTAKLWNDPLQTYFQLQKDFCWLFSTLYQ